MALIPNDRVTHLWRPPACQPARDTAREAYTSAIDALQKELDKAEQWQAWLGQQTDINGVVEIAEQARANHGESSGSMKWLDSISSRVVYYGAVLDMLAQHHPEYVSLVWGAIKFVLMGVINYSELMARFAKAFSEIGDALKCAAQDSLLYQTEDTKDLVSRLYLEIMRFCTKAVEWYNHKRPKQILKSLRCPYELSWKDNVEKIRDCSSALRNRSYGAMGAELRDVHIMVQSQGAKISDIAMAVMDLQTKFGGRFEEIFNLIQGHTSISQHILEGVNDVKPRVHDLQVSSIMQSLTPEKKAEDMLLDIQAYAKRNQRRNHHLANHTDFGRCFQRWQSERSSSLLIIRAKTRFEVLAKLIFIDIIKHLRSSPQLVFFALSRFNSENQTASMTSTLRSLIHQALQGNPDFLIQRPDKLQSAAYTCDHSEEEWLHLLSQIYATMPQSCLFFDTGELYEQYRSDTDYFHKLLGHIQTLIQKVQDAGSCIKVMFISYGPAMPAPESSTWPFSQIVCSLRVQCIPPRLQPQYTALNARRRPAWQRGRPKI